MSEGAPVGNAYLYNVPTREPPAYHLPPPSSEEAKLLPAAESSGAKGDVGPARSPASSTCLQRYTPRIIRRGIHNTLRTATTGSAVRSPDYPAQISGANALRDTLQTPEAWSSPSTDSPPSSKH